MVRVDSFLLLDCILRIAAWNFIEWWKKGMFIFSTFFSFLSIVIPLEAYKLFFFFLASKVRFRVTAIQVTLINKTFLFLWIKTLSLRESWRLWSLSPPFRSFFFLPFSLLIYLLTSLSLLFACIVVVVVAFISTSCERMRMKAEWPWCLSWVSHVLEIRARSKNKTKHQT